MFSSTPSLRPRQRTFTSCTECRRRKQRCNQAKDRPCNNCARRYPPVICEYESSSSTQSIGRTFNMRNGPVEAHDTPGGNDVSSTAYIQTIQPIVSDAPITSTSDAYYNANTYSTSSTDYRQYDALATNSNTQYIATSSGGFYQDQTNDSVAGTTQSHSGYYPIPDQQRNGWLGANGNSTTFVGSTSTYYYAEPSGEDQLFPGK